jgi:hypothetical protein
MDDDGHIPIVGKHRGVGLEDHQSPERLEVVKGEIDRVLGMTDPGELADYAGNGWNPPEARQLAAAMAETAWEMAAETRALRPAIDMAELRASVAGLGHQGWRDPWRYASLLDPDGVERERPLADG